MKKKFKKIIVIEKIEGGGVEQGPRGGGVSCSKDNATTMTMFP